jgi:two-component sensor histidine kinase
MRIAQQAARIGTWVLDLESGEVIWSDEQYMLFGRSRERDGQLTFARFLDDVVYPPDRAHLEAAVAASLASGELETDFRAWRPRKDGTRDVRWITGRGRRISGPDGKSGRMFGVNLDITDRKAAEERQTLLMREVDHRAKNALAVVQAALRLTPKNDAEAYAHAIEGRVAALARAHTMLANGKWEGATLAAVVEAELAAFHVVKAGFADEVPSGHRVTTGGPEVALTPDAVQALSMVLHELATNAAKHGSFSEPAGRVAVTWEVDCEAGRLLLTWRERGGPHVAEAPARRGFGSRLIEATAERQLGGVVQRVWDGEGLVCTISVPLARVLAGFGETAELSAAI